MASPAFREPAMLAEIREGLSRSPRELPPKYFYDRRGSELFERITTLPEYYLTRAERELLEEWSPALIEQTDARTLVELGAGSAEKTRLLLEGMLARHDRAMYVPIDVSADFLQATASALRSAYSGLEVAPVVADISEPFTLPPLGRRPALFAFLGSTIGNFDRASAIRLLRRVHGAMGVSDRLLLGADLRKDPATIEAAYNDTAGVTAEFNRNVLRVLNRELDADFDLPAFRHRAFYNRDLHRIEMHLVAERPMQVTIPGIGTLCLERGESIRTEISSKYDREAVGALFDAARLTMVDWRSDAGGRFALALAAPG